MDDDRLKAIEGRLAGSTPGPFEPIKYGHGGGRLSKGTRTLILDAYTCKEPGLPEDGDREFYFNARQDVEWLVERLRVLQMERHAIDAALSDSYDPMFGCVQSTLRLNACAATAWLTEWKAAGVK